MYEDEESWAQCHCFYTKKGLSHDMVLQQQQNRYMSMLPWHACTWFGCACQERAWHAHKMHRDEYDRLYWDILALGKPKEDVLHHISGTWRIGTWTNVGGNNMSFKWMRNGMKTFES